MALKSLALTIVISVYLYVYATKISIIFILATILVPKLIPNIKKERNDITFQVKIKKTTPIILADYGSRHIM